MPVKQTLSQENQPNLNNKIVHNLSLPVSDLNLSIRSSNCLKKKNINNVIDLVQLKEYELLKTRNFGRKSLNEINRKLSDLNLTLGMEIEYGLNDKKIVNIVDTVQIAKQKAKERLQKKAPFLFISINDISLSVRTYNCLVNLNVKYLGDLVQLKEFELLEEKNFGRKSLVEIKAILASFGLNLGIVIKGWPPKNIKELSLKFKKQIDNKNKIDGMKFRNSLNKNIDYLEDELFYILCKPVKSARDRSIIVEFFGWDGSGKHTLEYVGKKYNVTRERIRQIVKKYKRAVQHPANRKKITSVPIIDTTIQCILTNIPNFEETVEKELINKNITKGPFKIDGIISALELLNRSAPFDIIKVDKKKYIIPSKSPNDVLLPKFIIISSKNSVRQWGCVSVSDIVAQTEQKFSNTIDRDSVISFIYLRNDLIWLDSEKEWFWYKSIPRNRLINQIKKILSVCNKIDVSELRSGVRRHHRMQGFAPPKRILLNFCKSLDFCKVDGNMIIATEELDWQKLLEGNDYMLTAVLKEHGPAMSRKELQAKCLDYYMNENTFYAYLSYSPVVIKHAVGVYGLRRIKVQPGMIESLKPTREYHRVISDYGWTNDGRIWLGILLTDMILASGSFYIPSGMKNYLQGEYSLVSKDGKSYGKIKVKDAFGWNIKSYLKRYGGEEDDYIVLEFDINSRIVTCNIGDEDLLDDYLEDEPL